jgi:hypothetical protein
MFPAVDIARGKIMWIGLLAPSRAIERFERILLDGGLE